ncbi:hypothetical protein, partial [Sedimenticola sp.]|uniref:hypothetical protein n=1 Tax=Sedimenticola sp. TaxID=1940285 RepID=UPI003D12A6B1
MKQPYFSGFIVADTHMMIEKSIIRQAARVSGISEEDLAVFLAEGTQRIYQANEWLFQQSTPRQWAGIILEG